MAKHEDEAREVIVEQAEAMEETGASTTDVGIYTPSQQEILQRFAAQNSGNADVWASRLLNLVESQALRTNHEAARDHYGELLECRNIVVAKESTEMEIDRGSIELWKVTFNVRAQGEGNEWYWIDSYTKACNAFGDEVLESMGRGPWPVFLPIVFRGQVTSWHEGAGDGIDGADRLTDTVELRSLA